MTHGTYTNIAQYTITYETTRNVHSRETGKLMFIRAVMKNGNSVSTLGVVYSPGKEEMTLQYLNSKYAPGEVIKPTILNMIEKHRHFQRWIGRTG